MMKGKRKISAIVFLTTMITVISVSGIPGFTREIRHADPEAFLTTYLRENIIIHTDRGRYIAGEQIWFSIITTAGEKGIISGMSSLAYIELLNPWNNPVFQGRFSLRDGLGEGNFLLPDTLRSGTYTIRAYTNHMKNFPAETYFMHDIQIHNAFSNLPYIEKVSHSALSLIHSDTAESVTFHRRAEIITDSLFVKRDNVKMKVIAGLPEICNLTISVVPYGSEETIQAITTPDTPAKPENEKYGYEVKGHWLSLKIRYREGSPTDSSRYLFRSVQGKVAEFSYAERDTSGTYSFLLPVDEIERNFIIQTEIAGKNMSLEVEPSFSWQIPPSKTFPVQLADSILSIFSQLSFNYQASRIYNIVNYRKKPRPENIQTKKRRFYGIPEMEIILSDYITLPTMQEVFFELLPGIIIRPVKSGYEMRITNPLTGVFYAEPPLVMIDGIIINDLNVLADLDPELVEKIEVVKTPYLTGNLILHGIVNVITKTGDFSAVSMPEYAVMLPYKVVEEVPTFMAPDYSSPETVMNRIPDLRNTLYWNPLVKTNAAGEAVLDFLTSDLPGKYLIVVNGISGSGEKVYVRKSFIVK